MAKETPAAERSFSADPNDPRWDQLRAERRELSRWLRLITAKRDLVAAQVVPPLMDLNLSGAASDDFALDRDELFQLLGLDAPLPSNEHLQLLQRCAIQTSRRIAQLDGQLQAW